MKRRWFIRGLFIGLLVLCVGGWVGSYKYVVEVAHVQRGLICTSGGFYLGWSENMPTKWEWRWSDEPPSDSEMSREGDIHVLGVLIRNMPDEKVVGIPFYVPTTFSVLLLWIVWRKTRPRVNPATAFPVELKTKEGQP